MRAGSVHSQIRVCMVAGLIRLDQTECEVDERDLLGGLC